MATITVGNTGLGRDYATLQEAFNAIASPLTADYVIEIYNDAEYTGTTNAALLTCSGKTMSGHTITFRPASGHGFRDQVGGTPLRYDQTKGVALSNSNGGTTTGMLQINLAGVILDGLQIRNSSTACYYTVRGLTTGWTIKNCLVEHQGNTYAAIACTGANIFNCAVILRAYDSKAIRSDGANTVVIGNTVVFVGSGAPSGSEGVRINTATTLTAIDNVVLNCATAFVAGGGAAFSADSDYNATDLATIGTGQGTNNLTSLTAANQVEGSLTTLASADLRAKTGADIIGAGVANANIATDIFGTTRSDPPTIGAMEYVSGAAPAARNQLLMLGVG
jgi:hypothetical protein